MSIEVNWKTLDWHLDHRRRKKRQAREKEEERSHTYKRATQYVWRDEAFFAAMRARDERQTVS